MSLLELPSELLLSIADQLALFRDLNVLARVNRRLYALIAPQVYLRAITVLREGPVGSRMTEQARQTAVVALVRAIFADDDVEKLQAFRRRGLNLAAGLCRGQLSLLSVAAEIGKLNLVRFLVDEVIGGSTAQGINFVGPNGLRAIDEAIDSGHCKIIRFLLSRGAQFGPCWEPSKCNVAPITFAVLDNQPDIVLLLLQHGYTVPPEVRHSLTDPAYRLALVALEEQKYSKQRAQCDHGPHAASARFRRIVRHLAHARV
jgi:hypothetical protein